MHKSTYLRYRRVLRILKSGLMILYFIVLILIKIKSF